MSHQTTPTGYRINIQGISERERLDGFEVSILKNGGRWNSFPTNLEEGSLGRGPAGEYLNFTDLNGDGNLTIGDFFTLENLESETEYKLILFWAECSERINTETINVP